MATLLNRLRSHLDEHAVTYETIHHRADFTSQETAADTHTPGREFAKVVALRVDDNWAMAVLPAHHRVDLWKMRDALRAQEVRLATESEMETLFPDCELGAEPPFGGLYGIPVYVSASMEGDKHITFNAGTHEDVIRMSFREYRRLVKPKLIDLSRPKGS